MSTKLPIGPAWFWIAVQALVVIAEREGACPSGTIATDLKTHAVFLRRVMALLVRAGIVEAHEGRDGGYQLIHAPEQIYLSEVYKATQTTLSPEHTCTKEVTNVAQKTLERIQQEFESSKLEILSHYTIASCIQQKHTPPQEILLF